MTAIDDPPKSQRVVVYLDCDLAERLRIERAVTREPVSTIVNRMVRQHYERIDRRERWLDEID